MMMSYFDAPDITWDNLAEEEHGKDLESEE